MSDFYLLKSQSTEEIYSYIDKNIRSLPKNEDGSFDETSSEFLNNEVDALRHAYVSGIYTIKYGENISEFLGRLNELISNSSGSDGDLEENMDLWNNQVGREYGKKSKSKKELLKFIIEALKKSELIIDPHKDPRKFKGATKIKVNKSGLVIVIEQSETGENLQFYDVDKKIQLTKNDFLQKIRSGSYSNYGIKKINGKETPVSKRDRYQFNNLG